MSDQVVITVSRSIIHNFLGKAVLLVIAGGIIGYFVGQYELNKAAQWKQKTPAEKKAQIKEKIQEYEKDLESRPMPALEIMGITIAMLWLIFTFYELMGLGLSGVFRKILPFLETTNP